MEYLTDINCDILLLCETWQTSIKNDVTALVSICGYNFFHIVKNTVKKKRGGGRVGIIYKDTIKLIRLNCGKYSSFEYCGMYMCGNIKTKRFNFISFYRLLHISVSQFLLDFAVLLEIVSTYPGTVVIAGDVNIHEDNFLDNNTINFRNFTQSFSFTLMISEITHNKGHQQDILLTNDPTSVLQPPVLRLDVSDHKLIQFNVSIMTDTTNSYKLVEFRDYNGINLEKSMIELNDQMHANIFLLTLKKHWNIIIIASKLRLISMLQERQRKLKTSHHVLGLIMNMYNYDGREGKPKGCLKKPNYLNTKRCMLN